MLSHSGEFVKISLLVIRCRDLEASKNFYQLLGMSFTKEKHGNGPEHYSCEQDDCIFELYPNKGVPPNDSLRLGFKTQSVTAIMKQVSSTESYEYSGKKIYVVTDPDGRKIEVSE